MFALMSTFRVAAGLASLHAKSTVKSDSDVSPRQTVLSSHGVQSRALARTAAILDSSSSPLMFTNNIMFTSP